MKKLLIALLLLTTPAYAVHPTPVQVYQNGYRSGYDNGKQDAYNSVARTSFIIIGVVLVGTVIYELGKESRWTANQNGIAYRF